ncbi:hypothetical protein Pyn_04285 [Prunus yedoensis var. nudiflora]|uniref:LOB domain-containing protein n=1 Tax=Prunus yedoensis var. nudiflora TaxID=2094558 RepID=A0A314XI09_PRUYE|nr:hypothetical protein Pyn_04285 [Prunus yedoensis var. nudiflora]
MHDKAATDFSSIHNVFGSRKMSKILSELPISERAIAIWTMTVEAQARVLSIQAQLDEAHAQLACAVAHVANLNEQASMTNLNQVLENSNEQATVANRTKFESLPQFNFEDVAELLVDPWFSTYLSNI